MVKVNSRREVFSVTSRILVEVMEALKISTGKTLWAVSETDRYRLYRLWIWSQRHKVSLEYIFQTLIPYFTKGVEKRTGKKSKGIGVSIPVLTGDVAEEVLVRSIERDYPEGDHLSLYREQQIEAITALLTKPPEFPTRIKKPLQYKSMAAEVAAYKFSTDKAVKQAAKLESKLRKIPFRNNPYR